MDERQRDETEPAGRLIYWVHYVLVPMGQVPREVPWHEDCMRDAVVGETFPGDRSNVAGVRGCCWYHGGDWDAVTKAAVRLIAQVNATGVEENYRLCQQVLDAARADGMSGWPLQALKSLVKVPILIRKNAKSQSVIDNGQHRLRAMRDAGLTEVLVGKPHWRREDL
ncbi:ParB/Srx family N-terminal domain-containing protein [Amycolatopsis sp. NPDC051371]|uniref:ParB/Srx family N-terminal domain-containing protein n=1 Tax=Amycolatopsis sp. NPDC051371 TaxID=3155800 RepID=UPI003426B555